MGINTQFEVKAAQYANAADIIANAKRLRSKFYPSRQITKPQVQTEGHIARIGSAPAAGTLPAVMPSAHVKAKTALWTREKISFDDHVHCWIAHRAKVRHLKEKTASPLWRRMPLLYNSHVIDFHRWRVLSEEGKSFTVEPAKQAAVDIISEVLEVFDNVTLEQLQGKSRTTRIVTARQIAMYECRTRRPDLSFPTIGRYFGGRDHTTVLHAYKKIESMKASGELDWYYSLSRKLFGNE